MNVNDDIFKNLLFVYNTINKLLCNDNNNNSYKFKFKEIILFIKSTKMEIKILSNCLIFEIFATFTLQFTGPKLEC